MAKKIDLNKLVELINASDSWEQFKERVVELTQQPIITKTFIIKPQEELSDFNQKLKQGLNWNPKENKKDKQ